MTSRFGENKMEFLALSPIVEIRTKKELCETKLTQSIYVKGRLKRTSILDTDITN